MKHEDIQKFSDSIKESSAKYNEYDDCTVRALSFVTGIPYEDAHVIAKESGRPDREGWYAHRVIQEAMEYGYKFNQIDLYSILKRLGIKKISAKRFAELFPTGSLYVCRRGHAFAIINGKIYNERNDRVFIQIAYILED